jgi:hypothetical protein
MALNDAPVHERVVTHRAQLYWYCAEENGSCGPQGLTNEKFVRNGELNVSCLLGRPRWEEVRLGQAYNPKRVAVLHNGQLNMLQVGSSTGAAPSGSSQMDEASKADAYWDVFLCGRLTDFKVREAGRAKVGCGVEKLWVKSKVEIQKMGGGG